MVHAGAAVNLFYAEHSNVHILFGQREAIFHLRDPIRAIDKIA
jgi:hypothetical protein